MPSRSKDRRRTRSSAFESARAGSGLPACLLAALLALPAGGVPSASAQQDAGRIYVRRIELEGTTGIADEVLRREIVQLEAAYLNTVALDESLRRLERLPFIEDADAALRPVPGAPDVVDVVLALTQAPARRYGGGGGWSESLRTSLRAYYIDHNLLGTGQRLAFAIEGSELRSTVELSHSARLSRPAAIVRTVELSSRRLERVTRHASPLDVELQGAVLEFGFPLAGGGRTSATRVAAVPLPGVRLPRTDVRDRVAEPADVLAALRPGACCRSIQLGVALRRADFAPAGALSTQLGTWLDALREPGAPDSPDALAGASGRSARLDEVDFLMGFRQDTREGAVFPSRGALHQVRVTAALPGSDVEYARADYELSAYWPLGERWTMSVSTRFGFGATYGKGPSLPPYLNWFAGGPLTVRGFRESTLGPRDSFGNAYGGNVLAAAQLELLTPWPERWRDRVRVGFFADLGNVFSTEDIVSTDGEGEVLDYGPAASRLRASAGLAAQVLTPLGALRISYAIPIDPDDQHPNPFLRDRLERFQLSIGVSF